MSLFKHKKGGIYFRLFHATNTETAEQMTIYLHLWPHKIGFWARPRALFDQPDRFKKIL